MYIIELIGKILTHKKAKQIYNPLTENENENENETYEGCEHVFMPVDSTGEILSCTKCGFLAKRNELKNLNFFMGN